jgi:hypothetical protein
MKRWLFNIAAAVSLLLCVAMIVLWVRSCYLGTMCGYLLNTSRIHANDDALIASLQGKLIYVIFRENVPAGSSLRSFIIKDFKIYPASGPTATWRWGSFFYNHEFDAGSDFRGWGAPYWFLTAFFAVMPIKGLVRWRRTSRYTDGLCSSCGYDLRAMPERCPECGTVPNTIKGEPPTF